MNNELKNEINSYTSKDNNYSDRKPEKIFMMTEPKFFDKKIFSNTMKNIISQRSKKVKRYSISIRNEIFKKMEKKPQLNEKKIYAPLYVQIHKSLRDIENEIKIAQQYIIPENEIIKRIQNPRYNSILKLNQKNDLLIFNKEQADKLIRTGKSKTAMIRNKFLNKNFFMKINGGGINSSKAISRNNDLILKNKILTPRRLESHNINFTLFPKKESEESKIKSDFNIEENNNTILSPTNSNGPFFSKKTTLILKPEKKDTKTNLNLNLSSNKTLQNQNLQTLKSFNDESSKNLNKIRNKTFFVEDDPKWYFKNKFIKNKLDKSMVTNPLFQKKIIDDQLALLFEYMKIFQSQFLIDKNLSMYFDKISFYTQKELNFNLEESVGLLTEISYLILNGYENIIKNFISNPIPRVTKKKLKNVFDENKEFTLNISAFSETFIFLKVCYEAYNIISSDKEDYFIAKNNFELLNQYLDRARFAVSKVCLDLNNMYKDQNKEDKKIIEDCLKKIKNLSRKALINNLKIINNNTSNGDNNNKKNKKNKKKYKIDCHLKFGSFKSGIDSFSYKGPKQLKLTEEHLTNLRINKAFGSSSSRELKRDTYNKHFAKFNINSSLVNQLMKYATDEFKSKVISERIRQRFIKAEIS